VSIYDRVEEVVSYPRSWRRGQTFGAERFEKVLAEQRPAARRSQAQQRLLDSLDGVCSRSLVEAYLRDMAETDRALGRQITELLELIRQYGPEDLAGAIEKAATARAYGADYVANILQQQRSPRRPQPRLQLRDPLLNARNFSVTAILELLADLELAARQGRAIERRFKSSRLEAQPTIDAFHFHHHKSRTQVKTRILRLLDLTFLRQGTNLVLIGNPGVGKTFLARIFGWKACQANQRVLFTTAMDMLNHLLASQVDHSLVRRLKTYTEPTLLIVDELGYLSLDQQTSNLFYQVISTRHSQKRSTIITTNTPFSDWGNILFNTTIATAIADRLVENSEIFLLGGDSLRKTSRNSNPPEE
jgi:DNA replication protein DnaC